MGNPKQTTLSAFRMLFRPIAKILLHAGINWKDVASAGKAIYVDVASAEFGIRGRPTNVSRVAILTGLTRKEVSRLRKVLASESTELIDGMNHATRVLSGWFTDPDYVDGEGAPRALVANGRTPSFETLCRRFASDVPATTMLKELKHVGAVVENDEGRLVAKMRVYMPRQADPSRILSSGSVLEDLGNTVAYNLYRAESDRPQFERRATNLRVSASAVPEFQAFLEREGQAFLERVDAWLSDHETDDDGDAVRLGLGTYWIEE